MDWVLGNGDRNPNNFMLDKKGGLKLIDHGFAFVNKADEFVDTPDYLDQWHKSLGQEAPVQASAHDWARTLNPGKLMETMLEHEVPMPYVKAAVQRLNRVKSLASQKQWFGHGDLDEPEAGVDY